MGLDGLACNWGYGILGATILSTTEYRAMMDRLMKAQWPDIFVCMFTLVRCVHMLFHMMIHSDVNCEVKLSSNGYL